jgi:hypothetical protein
VSRYRFIAAEKAQYSVAQLCRVLQVAPSGYYAWQHRRTGAARPAPHRHWPPGVFRNPPRPAANRHHSPGLLPTGSTASLGRRMAHGAAGCSERVYTRHAAWCLAGPEQAQPGLSATSGVCSSR